MDGRIGHSTYLMFVLVFVNFILITYTFLLDGNTLFEKFISNLWSFSLVFVIFYVPISILIGRWHTNTQISVDMDLRYLENPIFAKMFRILLDAKTGEAKLKDIKEFKKFLSSIEKNEVFK